MISRRSAVRCISSALCGLCLVALLHIVCGCQRQEAYMQYEVVDVDSWDQAERLKYVVPPVEAGAYEERLHIRATVSNRFPFKALYVEVRQQWPDSLYVDTLCCDIDEIDLSNTGISVHQYSYPIRRLSLAKGDSAVVSVRHIMRQEEIPGISDVGVSLVRE